MPWYSVVTESSPRRWVSHSSQTPACLARESHLRVNRPGHHGATTSVRPRGFSLGGSAISDCLTPAGLRQLWPGRAAYLWLPRRVKMADSWIAGAIKRPGALRRQLGVPAGKRIPAATLRKAAKAPGVLGRRARLALTLARLRPKS